MEFLKIFIVAFLIFLAIDAVWLGIVAKKMYKNKIGHLMADKPKLKVALVFYLFYIVGLAFFVIERSIDSIDIVYALLGGAFFGAITYATYDLTNLSTLKKWPVSVTIIDILWGSFLCSVVSLLTYLVFI